MSETSTKLPFHESTKLTAPESESNLKNKVCSKLLNVVRFSYDNRDKVVMLAAGAALVYYSVATIKELITMYDDVKCKCYETCKNLEYISDYLRGKKYKCEECRKTYKHEKSFQKHKSQHEISHYLDNLSL